MSLTTHEREQAERAEAPDLSVVERIVAERGREKGAAIPILQGIQAAFGYLPTEALERVTQLTDITASQLAGISTFYSQFRHSPVGRHILSVCHGTACHVAGAEAITESVLRYLAIPDGGDTDPDRMFTVDRVACLGCCSLAPVMRIDDVVYGHLTRESAPKAIERFLREKAGRPRGPRPAARREGGRGPAAAEIRVGLGSCCVASGSRDVEAALERELAGLGVDVEVRCGSCVGMCHRVPLVEFVDPGGRRVRYGNVTPAAVANIVPRHVRPRGLLRKATALAGRALDRLFGESAWEPVDRHVIAPKDAPARAFLGKQRHVVLEGCGEMDPLDLDEYEAREGYQALRRCLTELPPEDIITGVEQSGLRGRGGAGFPTGKKWRVVRGQPASPKYVVMNGDEGDPGAFMDRMLLESYPHRVLEGLAIAARAVGASEGYLYIRAEYPLALKRVRAAIGQAEERHYLGDRILGTDFSLRLHIMEGAGAFVCGEETGLLASIEGRRGMPRFRPPFPAEAGLWGQPTSINNVETYAAVPWILRHGAAAYAAMGTATSKGTKVFALAGRINRGGLIEVPMGITIGEIVEEIGGGIRGGRAFKAIQIGGPSGGCLPASLRHVPIDYEALTQYGAIMGSGGLVVLDDATCMVDMARYFLQFTENESCGKCTFCRVGTKRMLEILDRLCSGQGRRGDVDHLQELGQRIKRTSLCGLGQTAPNPILTTLRYFHHEYEAHVEGRCPAKKCRALITYRITDDCIGCTLCAQHCPADAIEPKPYEKHEIDTAKCVRCGTCKSVCPADSVEVE
jgi:NADH-quinone oxidoreductase subunit F